MNTFSLYLTIAQAVLNVDASVAWEIVTGTLLTILVYFGKKIDSKLDNLFQKVHGHDVMLERHDTILENIERFIHKKEDGG